MELKDRIVSDTWSQRKRIINSLINNVEKQINPSTWRFSDPDAPWKEIVLEEWYEKQRKLYNEGQWQQVISNFGDFMRKLYDINKDIIKPRIIEPLRVCIEIIEEAEIILKNQAREIDENNIKLKDRENQIDELSNKNHLLLDEVNKMKEKLENIKEDYINLNEDIQIEFKHAKEEAEEDFRRGFNKFREQFNELAEDVEKILSERFDYALNRADMKIRHFFEDKRREIDEMNVTSKEREKQLTEDKRAEWKEQFRTEKELDKKLEEDWTKQADVGRSFGGWKMHIPDELRPALEELEQEYRQRLKEKSDE